MTRDTEDIDQSKYLTNWQAVDIHRGMIEKLFEFVIRDVEADLDKIDDLSLIEQLEIRAFWSKWVDLYFAFVGRMDEYAKPLNKLNLVGETFGDQFAMPSNSLKPDLERRLDWFKKRVAKDFEREFTGAVDTHKVTSPVEQIFLMQWNYERRNRGHTYLLQPQNEVAVDGTVYAIDFVVTHPDHSLRLAVELDGHEFHEKTKQQVAKDKKRERMITSKGYRILRFSGYEVVKSPLAVVDEVLRCADSFTNSP